MTDSGAWVMLAVLAVAPQAAAARHKASSGQVMDRSAFARIKSYCIDLSGMEDYESYDMRGFIRQGSEPGKLPSKIPWKFESDCTWPDAASDTIQRHNAVYNAFWTLAQDIRRVGP